MNVQKVLRSLPRRFNAKVSAIDEMANLKDLKMDQLLGTLTTYEMRVGREKYEPKEVVFKVSKKAKDYNDHQECSICKFDQELAQFAKKLNYGLGKYKGKFPFKLFDCGRVRNFSSKFPYKKRTEMEDDHEFRNKS